MGNRRLLWIKETVLRPMITETNDIRVIMEEPLLVERVIVELSDTELVELLKDKRKIML